MGDDQIKKDAIAATKRVAALTGYGEITDKEAEEILRRLTGVLEEMYINGDELSELSELASTPVTYRPVAR